MEYDGVEFRLTDNFLGKYKRRQPEWGPMGYFVYKRTYARQTGPNKTEEFWQTLQRVVEGCFLVQKRHCLNTHLPWNERKAQGSAQKMFNLMWEFKFLPPGRGLWSMGTEFMFKKGSACLNNCGFVSTANLKDDFASPFVWLMDMSMQGVGVGFDTEGAHCDTPLYLKSPRTAKEPHVADDSREGWVECFRRVLDAYVGRDTIPSEWDLSQIRPAGAPIKGFGGTAPGPDPLRVLIERTDTYCNRYVREDRAADSTLIVDLMNFAGAAVVAGGIRRTAEIAFGRNEDEEFQTLKSQDNIEDSSLARWASNNSIFAEVGQDYTDTAARASANGEPGYFWLDNARAYGRTADGKRYIDRRVAGCNPCGEQSLESYELCNLVETFPSRHKSYEEYETTLKYAYLYAKTVTLLKTHDARTNAVLLRNRRIGLSQSGIIESINKIGFREHLNWCDKGYDRVGTWDETYSDWLCIPKSIKRTTVKPSGTVSLLPGVTPGIHFPHSEYYIRRVRVAEQTSLWKTMAEAGYKVEKDEYAANTMVIEFPIHEANFDRSKDQISIWEQFELAAALQAKWSDNQVSITITIPPMESNQLPRALSMYEKRLKAVSFLPLRGDDVYKQAPYERITEEGYTRMVDGISKVKLNPIDDEDRVIERFCDGDSCEVVPAGRPEGSEGEDGSVDSEGVVG